MKVKCILNYTNSFQIQSGIERARNQDKQIL